MTEESILWVIMPCSSVEVHQCCRRLYHLHLQVWRVCQARNQQKAGCFNPENGSDMVIWAVGRHPLTEWLLSNGWCIIACSVVVAYVWVNMSQYCTLMFPELICCVPCLLCPDWSHVLVVRFHGMCTGCLSTHLFINLSVLLSMCLPIHILFNPSIWISNYPSICLLIYLSFASLPAYLSIYISANLFIYQPVSKSMRRKILNLNHGIS
jgi:hypothetical protein